jgi:hypothetical protein
MVSLLGFYRLLLLLHYGFEVRDPLLHSGSFVIVIGGDISLSPEILLELLDYVLGALLFGHCAFDMILSFADDVVANFMEIVGVTDTHFLPISKVLLLEAFNLRFMERFGLRDLALCSSFIFCSANNPFRNISDSSSLCLASIARRALFSMSFFILTTLASLSQ